MTEQIQAEMEEIKINTHVLVIGGGYTGLNAARKLADSGYPVILACAGKSIGDAEPRPLGGLSSEALDSLKKLTDTVDGNKNIEVLANATLKASKGAPGNFTVRLSVAGGEVEKTVGAVVLATDFSATPLNERYGLALSDKVMTLSQMETLLESAKDKLANKTVAFMFGFAQESNPLIMERVFRSVLGVEDVDGSTPYVYAGNLKVASEGLERIYLASRDKGATYFKLKEMPNISENGDVISFKDPVLGKEMELTPDIVVIEEAADADPINAELAEILHVDLGPGAFLQTDNVHRFPVRSNREGIFVVGGTRNVQSIQYAMMDVENTVLEIRALLKDGTVTVSKDKAVIDIGKCTFCITCYRCCPHGAISWDISNKPVISTFACQGCGICASECPMDAIQIGGYTDGDMLEKIKFDGSKGTDPKILAFCCQNSAYEAGIMADAYNMPKAANLQVIKVPCAGKVDIQYMMNALVEGADGVLVMACHPGNCKSEKGNTFAGWRVDDLHRMMEEIGLEKERLQFVTLASNMGSGFSAAVTEMENTLKTLGN